MNDASQQSERQGSTDGQRGWRSSMQEASPYLGLGMQLALSMLFFVGIGYALDEWLDTTPWLLVAGAMLGMTALFIQLYRVANTLGGARARGAKRRNRTTDPDTE